MANPVQNSLKQSNLSLNKIQSSVKSFSKSMSSARNTTTTLNKSLTESSRQKRKALQVDHIRFFRRRDAVRKRENENIIENILDYYWNIVDNKKLILLDWININNLDWYNLSQNPIDLLVENKK